MAGFITKKEVLTNLPTIYRMGGVKLIVRCLTARGNVTFLSLLMED